MTEDKRSNEEHETAPTKDMMTMQEVADYLGIQYSTFTSYYYRGFAPKEDLRHRYVRLWKKETIDNWHNNRPHPRKG
ncbi:hypothetical protein PBI_CANTARE_50 [Brevibacterium phage Cantare]|uniref:Uncharacterized protein n=1 Tax=Brevibacterium phage Cantare TaxID=2338395 RepID=A0A3G3LYQ3_9CAUD|nr:hypothetical protein PQD70_gp050 [Brevibacterium phage Cantare]AYQ99270.1 hypothetical protein PBI_CANTARE_50 [Brevibacterium phage Cantare]